MLVLTKKLKLSCSTSIFVVDLQLFICLLCMCICGVPASIGRQWRLQHSLATSTMEVEYMVIYAAIQKILWKRGVMTELGIKDLELFKSTSPKIQSMHGNSAIGLAQNLFHHSRSSTFESRITGFVSK